MADYLKIGKATELKGGNRALYRTIEIIIGSMSWLTLIALIVLSYFKPVWIAYFVIFFDVYWLLLVLYLMIHLFVSFNKMQKTRKVDWLKELDNLTEGKIKDLPDGCLAKRGIKYKDIIHVVIVPTLEEPVEVVRPSIQSVLNDGYPPENIIYVLALEEREGEAGQIKGRILKEEFESKFRNFVVTTHPDGIIGELKGKGANQDWAAKRVKKEIIDQEGLDYGKILISVFDSDTVVYKGYFSCLTFRFLTVENPYNASYQPVPLYHNNIWDVQFFSRVAAASNTFWQMMQQIRVEKLATYSSHSMTWKTIVEIDFWSTAMVSEDSRIFWHCFLAKDGDYRVEPLYFPISMDSIKIENTWKTIKGLYKQQQRWGWGVENVPYMIFNTIKRWKNLSKKKAVSKILVQIHGFHSWATNALIIAVIGWMPLLLGGDAFKTTVLSGNLPVITRTLMTLAMSGLVVSSVVATILLPKRPKHKSFFKYITMLLEWILLPIGIIIFGAIPALDAQTHLLFGKYLGFSVTRKERTGKQKKTVLNH